MKIKERLAQVGITKIFIIIGIMLIFSFIVYSGFVMADEPIKENSTTTHTRTTDTICKDGVCNKVLYSGIRNVQENDSWVRVENAKSLKGKGFDVVYLEEDGTHEIDVVDFNMSYLELDFSYDKDNLGEYEIEIKEGKNE